MRYFHSWVLTALQSPLNSVGYNAALTEMRRRLGIVEVIGRALEDESSVDSIKGGLDSGWGLDVTQAACEVLIGRLENQEIIDGIQGPSGPKLAASQLHPWVWHAAVDLWDDGHFSNAVVAASSAIFDGHLPAKVGIRTAKGARDLVTKAFSPNAPTPTEPRLRFPDLTEGTAEWTNAHEGAMDFGQGCAQGIRNVTTHGSTPSEQVALEALVALSLLARWIDEAIVVTAPSP
jgi:hypothetical protein